MGASFVAGAAGLTAWPPVKGSAPLTGASSLGSNEQPAKVAIVIAAIVIALITADPIL